MTCRCFHHKFVWVLALLGGWTVLGFFIALFTRTTFLGFESIEYFMSVVVLSLAMSGTKFCGCCRHHMYKGWMQEGGMKEEPKM